MKSMLYSFICIDAMIELSCMVYGCCDLNYCLERKKNEIKHIKCKEEMNESTIKSAAY